MNTRNLALYKRFREPSSWAGIAVLLSLAGVPVGVPELVVQIGSGLAGVLAFAMGEGNN